MGVRVNWAPRALSHADVPKKTAEIASAAAVDLNITSVQGLGNVTHS